MKKYRSLPLSKLSSALALLSLAVAAPLASADVFEYRVSARGVRSPLSAPTLAGFSVPPQILGSNPFQLTGPNSDSSGAFTYTSSNPSVATVSGNIVTVLGVGTSIITALQSAHGNYTAGNISAVLEVTPQIAPTLGAFSVRSAAAGDPAFVLTPPNSNSGGDFSYTSSNTAVATISGNLITPLSAGTSTITVTQAAHGIYAARSTTAIFTVRAPLPSNYASSGGLAWSFPAGPMSYTSSVNHCKTALNGQTGWRLPSQAELAALYADRAQAGYLSKGWPVSSSAQPYGLMRTYEASTSAGSHMAYYLGLGRGNVSQPDENAAYEAYVTCVRPAA
jgi:hypothetical protein